MHNFSNRGLLGSLYKAAAPNDMPPGQQAMYAAANMAKPPGAPPLPKPISSPEEAGGPAEEALARQDEELAKQKAENEKLKMEEAHRKEVAARDKEIAALRGDLNKANLEVQKMRMTNELARQHKADMDKLTKERASLDSRRDAMASEEAQHKSRLAEATSEARARMAEERAKGVEQSAMQNAKTVERNAMQNAREYVRMTDDARKKSQDITRGAAEDIMRQREDVLKQKETLLADKSKAFDERRNAENARNRTSPYLMKSLQDAASSARNIAKLRNNSLNRMDNVFLSDMRKESAAGQTYTYVTPGTASPTQVPSSGTAATNGQTPTTYSERRLAGIKKYNLDKLQAEYGLMPSDSAYQNKVNQARAHNLASQVAAYGREAPRNADGTIVTTATRQDGKAVPSGNQYKANMLRQLSTRFGQQSRERESYIRANYKPGSKQYMDLARLRAYTTGRRGMLGTTDKSMFEKQRDEYSDEYGRQSGIYSRDMSWSDPHAYWKWAPKLGELIFVDPIVKWNRSWMDTNQMHDIASAYGSQLNHFSKNKYQNNAYKADMEALLRSYGLGTGAWAETMDTAARAGLAAVDYASMLAGWKGALVGGALSMAGDAAMNESGTKQQELVQKLNATPAQQMSMNMAKSAASGTPQQAPTVKVGPAQNVSMTAAPQFNPGTRGNANTANWINWGYRSHDVGARKSDLEANAGLRPIIGMLGNLFGLGSASANNGYRNIDGSKADFMNQAITAAALDYHSDPTFRNYGDTDATNSASQKQMLDAHRDSVRGRTGDYDSLWSMA